MELGAMKTYSIYSKAPEPYSHHQFFNFHILDPRKFFTQQSDAVGVFNSPTPTGLDNHKKCTKYWCLALIVFYELPLGVQCKEQKK